MITSGINESDKRRIVMTETTDWPFANHTYVLSHDKLFLFGYRKVGEVKFQMFKTPMKFSARKRTFNRDKMLERFLESFI